MKKYILLVVSFLFLVNYVKAQEVEVRGTVQSDSGLALGYVNIGIVGTPIGTVSDSIGNYKLFVDNVKELLNDSLVFSSIGYETRIIFLKREQDLGSLNVELKSVVENLEEVVISKNNKKSFSIGKSKTNTKSTVNFAISKAKNQNLGSEIGKKFKISSRKDVHLTNFEFYISYNDFDNVKFRINIYSLKKGIPNKILNTENIIIDVTDKKTGWIEVDLYDYNIITKNNVAVCVEWIEHSKKGRKLSLPMIIPSLGSIHFYKFGSQSKWKKYKALSSAMLLEYEK